MLSRRNFLKLGGITAVAAGASACSVMGQKIAQQDLPETLVLPPSQPVDPALRILNRAGYGPRPGDVQQVRDMGLEAYLEEQLQPEKIDDNAADTILRSLDFQQMDISQLLTQDGDDLILELVGSTLLKAVYSKRQLYEAMVEFWSDHFNIFLRKNEFMPALKTVDDKEVIRPHALGKFRDLLFATAFSPAMLVYLDNIRNTRDELNENYGRELLELHTLGVHAGYTQKDVQEAARAFTGLTVRHRGPRQGHLFFDYDAHDQDEKVILGKRFPANQGQEDIHQLLEMLVTNRQTAVFIATKLVRRFVADEPPESLVQRVAQTYQDTDGDIKAMLRVIFLSDAFATAPPKLKRPFTYMVSVLRAVHTDFRLGRGREIGRWLRLLGQVPFHWPPPDGFPDTADVWAANLLPRWNFALTLVNNQLLGAEVPLEKLVLAGQADQSPEAVLDFFSRLLNGRSLIPAERQQFQEYVGAGSLDDETIRQNLKDSVALMLASPAFQWT
ncbi:MAG: hypothetical protein CSA11_08255 [Chloroflexi bacterium]|nr:MAG: hypothetical protein CSA11_08255 [Chloroflexota bacterium]